MERDAFLAMCFLRKASRPRAHELHSSNSMGSQRKDQRWERAHRDEQWMKREAVPANTLASAVEADRPRWEKMVADTHVQHPPLSVTASWMKGLLGAVSS